VLTLLRTGGMMIFYGIFGLYALDRFNYGTEEVGIIFMVVGLISALTQGLLTGPLTKRWGEPLLIKAALLTSSVGFILLVFAETFWTVMLSIGVFIFATSLLIPAVTALTSKRAESMQGMTMGLSNSFMSLGRIIGPMWAGFVYDINLVLPYISGAVIMIAGFLVSLIWLRQEEPVAVTS
jgi:DHA1 family multidrug resistance protein-like MFS transporter